MNIDKLKHQHQDIIGAISALRTLAQAGVAQNAADIARLVVSMSSTIKLHLAVEDQALYPALRRGGNPELARMGQQYQEDGSVVRVEVRGTDGDDVLFYIGDDAMRAYGYADGWQGNVGAGACCQ